MKIRSLVALSILTLAPPAFAQDYCIRFPYPFTTVLVGKEFTFPHPNHCRAWNGWQNIGGQLAATTGSACSDGKIVSFFLSAGANENLIHDVIQLSIATQQGDDFPQGEETGQSYMGWPTAVSGHPCTGEVMP